MESLKVKLILKILIQMIYVKLKVLILQIMKPEALNLKI